MLRLPVVFLSAGWSEQIGRGLRTAMPRGIAERVCERRARAASAGLRARAADGDAMTAMLLGKGAREGPPARGADALPRRRDGGP